MSILTARPLPECAGCGMPTSRKVHERNHGLCTPCADGITDAPTSTVRMLPIRPDVNETTVYVERYRPPVPGQLELGEGER